MNAVILSIGDELVLGQCVDTNAAWLSARLAERGIETVLHLTVADRQSAIADAIRYAADEARLVIITGGLGPTDDDLTRQALAEVLGVGLRLHPPSLEHIKQIFQRLGRQMPQRNEIQAMIPEGAEALDNQHGTAPGIRARINGTQVYVLPGVPHEMMRMYQRHILPNLPEQSGRVILTATINTYGAGESTVAEKLGKLTDRRRNPLVGTTVSEGIISVRIRSDFPTRDDAERRMEGTIADVERALGVLVFGRDSQTLQEVIGRMLKSAGKTLATAESCTGGMLGQMITQAPGSSDYYLGGYVTYSNDAKTRDLGVASELIAEHGAVSEAVAAAMAEGALQRSGADYALAITGIAGPDGGTEDKPVGTVWIALAEKDREPAAKHLIFPGDRDVVRDRAAKTALNLLRLRLIRSE